MGERERERDPRDRILALDGALRTRASRTRRFQLLLSGLTQRAAARCALRKRHPSVHRTTVHRTIVHRTTVFSRFSNFDGALLSSTFFKL